MTGERDSGGASAFIAAEGRPPSFDLKQPMSRRNLLGTTAATIGVSTIAGAASAAVPGRSYKRIATEEHWVTADILKRNATDCLPADRSFEVITRDGPLHRFADRLLDLGAGRLSMMDKAGVDMQLLLITSPGVQQFAPELAIALARDANDQLGALVRAQPDRFAALAVCAPQAPVESAREIERAINKLNLNGVVIHSHTNGEYLSDPKYWPILEAAEALDAPIYIHPRMPGPRLIGATDIPHGLGFVWGFGVETGTHWMSMLAAGVFDRFPKLKIVLGHGGESIPNWLPRIDNRYLAGVERPLPLRRLPSEYARTNLWVTTSGMNYEPQVKMCLDVMGPDRVMYAIDYPFEDAEGTVSLLEAMRLSTAQKRALCETVATTVFKLQRAGRTVPL